MTAISSPTLKAKPPRKTIAHLRHVLDGLGLAFSERQWRRNPSAMSVRLELPDLQFGVNGKGVNKTFALASAYGELFERMQNISIFNHLFRSGNARGDALQYPDQAERRYSLRELDGPLLRHLFEDRATRRAFAEAGPHASIPFYSVQRAEAVHVPEMILSQAVGTNGMAAGNTPAEAIIQGIGEIFERYVVRTILCDGEEPPEIPRELAPKAIIERYVTRLERLGYRVYLKDCTLEGRFPVAGIFVRRGDRGLFHCGAAPDIEIALTRCFTELLQGETIAGLHSLLRPILPDDCLLPPQFWRQEFCRAFRDYKSAQKSAMFRNGARMRKSHVFRSNDLTSEATLRRLLRTIEDLGCELLIRDHTFLGFPAYQLFVPGLSELRPATIASLGMPKSLRRARLTFFDLADASKEELQHLTAVIAEFAAMPTADRPEVMETIHNLPVRRDSTLCLLDYRWFASVIHFHLEEYAEAERLIDELIAELEAVPTEVPAYYRCMREIFGLRRQGASWDQVSAGLEGRYSRNDLLLSYFPLIAIENVCRYFRIPACRACECCDTNDCAAKSRLEYRVRLQAMIDLNMRQDAVRSFFQGMKRTRSRESAHA